MKLPCSRKRSVIVKRRRTSISLEDSFWDCLNAIVRTEDISISGFIEDVASRPTVNLSSSLRVAVLEYYRRMAEAHLAK
jgi:predicted DNA-binding ribbon-helix-helix protein